MCIACLTASQLAAQARAQPATNAMLIHHVNDVIIRELRGLVSVNFL